MNSVLQQIYRLKRESLSQVRKVLKFLREVSCCRGAGRTLSLPRSVRMLAVDAACCMAF